MRIQSFVQLSAPLILSLLTWSNSYAQEAVSADDPLADVLAGHSFHGSAFNEGARQAARILGGTGNVEFKVTTKSQEAQKFFNQGVGQLHGFWDLEAERSFRQAAMIDPDCAMAYWGAALATFEKAKRASGFVSEAMERIESVSDREKRYIEALDRYFHGSRDKKGDQDKTDEPTDYDGEKKSKSPNSAKANAEKEPKEKKEKLDLVNDKNRKERAARYLKDLEDIVLQYPDDIEAKALVVHRIWYNARAGWPIGSYVAAEALLKEIFAINPMHPAHHYRIHVWDTRKPAAALESAGMCGLSAPKIAHMWHMPGHIFSRLHRYDEAVYYQEASARIDHLHMITDHVIPDQIHNYAHNNEWLTRNYVFLGRANDALNLAINLVELPRHPKYNAFDLKRRGSLIYGQRRLVQVLREFQMLDRLDEVETRGCFDQLGDDESVAAQRLLGSLAAIGGDGESENGARQQLSELMASTERLLDEASERVETLTWQIDDKRQHPPVEAGKKPEASIDKSEFGDRIKKAKKNVERYRNRIKAIEKSFVAIDGYRAVASFDYLKAVELLNKAEDEDKSWIAELKFLGGETDEAIEELRQQVQDRPNQSIPLARLAWCMLQNGDKEEAERRFRELREIAIGADLDIELFARLTDLAKSCGFDSNWAIAKSNPRSDSHFRPPLDSLGPVHWSPSKAPNWEVIDSDNQVASADTYAGKNYLMIFYLGHGCLHCAEQLSAFGPRVDDFRDAGIEMIAISSDDHAGLSKSLDNYNGRMPIRLASNSKLDIFKAFRAHDDFESQPLHGTFLIDARGHIRWQDISYEPFMDHEFLLNESKRLLKFSIVNDE